MVCEILRKILGRQELNSGCSKSSPQDSSSDHHVKCKCLIAVKKILLVSVLKYCETLACCSLLQISPFSRYSAYLSLVRRVLRLQVMKKLKSAKMYVQSNSRIKSSPTCCGYVCP